MSKEMTSGHRPGARLLRFAAATAAPALYALWIRPRLLTWGATRDEIICAYPGDELIPDADRSQFTMATTLPAPPERVWPWLVQMGGDRAGFYSWDRLDHHGEPSADRIVPEWQNLVEGQRLNSEPSGQNWMTVAVLEPNRSLVLRSNFELPSGRSFDPRSGPLSRAYLDGVWAFISARPPVAEPGWWHVRAAAAARNRLWGRSACCWESPYTSSCKPASSTTCALGSPQRCDIGRGSGGSP